MFKLTESIFSQLKTYYKFSDNDFKPTNEDYQVLASEKTRSSARLKEKEGRQSDQNFEQFSNITVENVDTKNTKRQMPSKLKRKKKQPSNNVSKSNKRRKQ